MTGINSDNFLNLILPLLGFVVSIALLFFAVRLLHYKKQYLFCPQNKAFVPIIQTILLAYSVLAILSTITHLYFVHQMLSTNAPELSIFSLYRIIQCLLMTCLILLNIKVINLFEKMYLFK